MTLFNPNTDPDFLPNALVRLRIATDQLVEARCLTVITESVVEEFAAILFNLANDLQSVVLNAGKKKAKHYVRITFQELINVYDRLFRHTKMLARQRLFVQPLNDVLQLLDKELLHIKQQCPEVYTANFKETDSRLLSIRCGLLLRFHKIRKWLLKRNELLAQALAAGIRPLLSSGSNQTVTRCTIKYITILFTRLEELSSGGSKQVADIDIMLVLIKEEFNEPLFIEYCKEYLEQRAALLATEAERKDYFLLKLPELSRLCLDKKQPLNKDKPSVSNLLKRWIKSSAAVWEQKEKEASFRRLSDDEREAPVRITFLLSAAVIAEMFKMLRACGVLQEGFLTQLFEKVAALSCFPKSSRTSGNYLLTESKRNGKKARQVLLKLLDKFRDYLNNEGLDE